MSTSIAAPRPGDGASKSTSTAGAPRLRPHALGFPSLLAQSVAVISPTMTAVLIIALAFADAGQGTWAAYLFGTIMLLFVVLGLNQFARYFYPQVHKKAFIIDVRGNGGGNVSPMLIERLRREIAMITIARNSIPRTDPAAMVYGPMVCLMNEFSASDGDLFPYRF